VISPGVDAAWYRPDDATRRSERRRSCTLGASSVIKEWRSRCGRCRRRGERAGPDPRDRRSGRRPAAARGAGTRRRSRGCRPVPRFVPQDEKRRLLRRAWAVVFPARRKGGESPTSRPQRAGLPRWRPTARVSGNRCDTARPATLCPTAMRARWPSGCSPWPPTRARRAARPSRPRLRRGIVVGGGGARQ